MPPSRSTARSSGVTLSGLDSVVTSAPGTRPNSSSIVATTRVRSRGGRSVGVPPPKKTVSTGTSRAPSTLRARRISSMTESAYVVRETPPPSSAAV